MSCRVGSVEKSTTTVVIASLPDRQVNRIRPVSVLATGLLGLLLVTRAFGQQPDTETDEDLAAEMKRFPAVEPAEAPCRDGPVVCRERLGGLLKSYQREAA